MQSKKKQKKPVQLVKRPIVYGSWHGRDAWKMGLRRMLSVLGITLLYVLASAFLSFQNFWARVLVSVALVMAMGYYQYGTGAAQGQNAAAYGEILYTRRENGKEIPAEESERSYHRLKGFFAVAVGCLPYVLFALVFACMTQKTTYHLGVLPSWTEGMLHRTEFGEGLVYYANLPGMGAVDVMRVIDRALMMPFINVATALGADASLLAERLSPLLILIAPMGYGIGYAQGLHMRALINTGIKMGDDKKKRREKKARKQRQHSKAPERLI